MDRQQNVVNIRVSDRFYERLKRRIDTINRNDPHGRTLTNSAFIRSLVERELEEDGDEQRQ